MAYEDTQAPVLTDKLSSPGCHHYGDIDEIPWDLQRYFHQRYSIFSRYDDGIWMTDDSWFSVTPEPVANKIAKHVGRAASPAKSIIIDCFAGVGGNTIAFARDTRWTKVYAIEKDGASMECAKQNARIYGVEDQISWHLGDYLEVLEGELKKLGPLSIIFASPPWGGPEYRSDAVFDLGTMQPYSLSILMESFQALTQDIAIYLPRTSDVRQIAQYVQEGKRITVIHYCVEGASKAICAYFGLLLKI